MRRALRATMGLPMLACFAITVASMSGTPAMALAPVAVPAASPTRTLGAPSPEIVAFLMVFTPPCASDDGSGPAHCHWDARGRGDGRGQSFIILDGWQYDVD